MPRISPTTLLASLASSEPWRPRPVTYAMPCPQCGADIAVADHPVTTPTGIHPHLCMPCVCSPCPCHLCDQEP